MTSLEIWETATSCSSLQEVEDNCGYNQGAVGANTWTATRTFEGIPSGRQSHRSHHRAPQGAGPARRGGRRVDVPSCRPVLLQKTKMNDNEVRLWEACSEHSGVSLKLQHIGTAAGGLKIYGQQKCWTGWLSQVLPFTWLTHNLFLTWRNIGFGLQRSVSGWLLPLPAFCPFHLLSQALHWEECNAMYKP